ncbi:MAG: ABC transporter permease, partial [Coprobacillus sp.]
MRKFLTYIKIEGLLSIRCIDIVFFGMIMPIGIAALIAGIVGSSQTSEGYTFLQGTFGAIMTVGICATSLMGIPLLVADYRDKKILKQFFVTPTHPIIILLVQVIISAVFSIISSVLIYLMLTLFFGYTIQGSVSMLMVSYCLVMFAMYGIGMLMASICRTVKLANLVCTIVYFPMLFL